MCGGFWRGILLAALTVPALTVAAVAAAGDGARPELAVPFTAAEPALDAATGDPVWRRAAVIGQFSPPLAMTFAAPPQNTRVLALWTKQDLFLRFECAGAPVNILPEAPLLPAAPPPRDLQYFKGDCVEVFLDPVGDAREYIELQFNPGHGVFDGVYLFTSSVESDARGMVRGDLIARECWFFKEWDLAGLRNAATVSADGWRVTVALPAAALLQRRGLKEFSAGLRLRANFVRFDYAAGAGHPPVITNWARVVEGRAHRSPQAAGTLTLVD
ncbi:MAG: carbohydrate-binding family 9-like protein [Verrucomicrobiales bacterium]|jgi:hypothetical protein|nr:carbohydrate-binding family 9-like protein [Verrucomicrobiales bacterium]